MDYSTLVQLQLNKVLYAFGWINHPLRVGIGDRTSTKSSESL
jgi:hypothetical protein